MWETSTIHIHLSICIININIDRIAYEAMQIFEANSNIELDIKRLIYKWKLRGVKIFGNNKLESIQL